MNIGSLSKHIDELRTLLDNITLTFDVLAITETRITADSIPYNIELQNYTCVQTKTESTAGGVLIYVRENIASIVLLARLNSILPSDIELIPSPKIIPR